MMYLSLRLEEKRKWLVNADINSLQVESQETERFFLIKQNSNAEKDEERFKQFQKW